MLSSETKKEQRIWPFRYLSRLENLIKIKLEKLGNHGNISLETLGSVALRVDSTPVCRFRKLHAGNFFVKGKSSQQKKKNKFSQRCKTLFWVDILVQIWCDQGCRRMCTRHKKLWTYSKHATMGPTGETSLDCPDFEGSRTQCIVPRASKFSASFGNPIS
ncbi:hypothetical protein Tco_0078130 [Tanacetum coccineum]